METILNLIKRLEELLPATNDPLLILATPLVNEPDNKKQLRDYCKSVGLSNTNVKTVASKLIPDLIRELHSFLYPEGVINHRQIEKLKREGFRVLMVQMSNHHTAAAVGIVTSVGRIYCQYDLDQLDEIADILYWGHPLSDFALEKAA